MRETERRIKEYQQRLPHLKEKLAAVAIMLVMSVVMMTSSTFAWLVLSKSPEVTGIDTTVAANGNLEIALVDKDGKEPDPSEVGDSGKDIIVKNVTWGNLVNLSDPSYGLENITLRPAALNLSELLDSPLRSAEFGDDGRVTKLTSDFAYTNYDAANNKFVAPKQQEYGVRAISSVEYGSLTGDATYIECLEVIDDAMFQAQTKYNQLIKSGNNPYIDVISGLMGDFMSANLGDEDVETLDCTKYVVSLNEMLIDFDEVIETTGNAMVYIANTQILLNTGEVGSYDLDSLISASSSKLAADGIKLLSLAQYKTDRAALKNHLVTMADYVDDTSVTWGQIKKIVNFMVDINSCIIKTSDKQMTVGNISTGTAASMILSGQALHGVITKGALKNLEQILGGDMRLNAKNIKIKLRNVPVFNNYTVTASSITTNAAEPFTLYQDLENTKAMYGGEIIGTDALAVDIYGMALDFWVRTNAQDSFLILEGEAQTKDIQDTDKDGNPYYQTEDEYLVVLRGGKYYSVETGQEIEGLTSDLVSPVYKTVVTGYDGVNRIWEEGALGGADSSTQGAGSCYVFYSDNPQDVQQALELLESLKIAFINDKGDLLAYADMNVAEAFEEPGRVTVPLVVRENDTIAGTDELENPIYGITELQNGVATRITAIVYLEGSELYNDEVLSAADMQGQLNIQFGSSTDMEHAEDNKLYDEEISISASVDKTTFDFKKDAVNGKVTTDLTVTIGGRDAATVGVNFARVINSTQGKRLNRVNLGKVSEGAWKKEVSFAAPGIYTLRTVWIDGVEYRLKTPITITITGFAIDSVSWTMKDVNGYANVMTSDSWIDTSLTVGFGTDSIIPKKVQAVFESDNNQAVTVNLNAVSSYWQGDVRFITSGTYTLKYIIVDGEYYEVPADKQKILTAYLGVSTRVWVDEADFVYEGPKTLTVSAIIMDDKNYELKSLNDVILAYRFGNSANTVLLDSDMVWNANTERYEGKFLVSKAGTYSFRSVTVGDNSTITNAMIAPVIRAIPPEPPEYNENKTISYQFTPDKKADFSVSISNSETAVVKAVIEKEGSQNLFEVDGEIGVTTSSSGKSITTWKFAIPEENQEGTWVLKELHIQEVYYDNQYVTGENWLIWDMTKDNIITRVANNVHVKVDGKSQTFTGYFMDSHVANGITVTIADYSGAAVPDVANVKLAYHFIDGSNTNYTSEYLNSNPTDAHTSTSFTLAAESATKYVADSVLSFKYAGKYAGELQFTVGGKMYAYAHNTIDDDDLSVANYTVFSTGQAPTYEVQWTTPIVKFTGVNPPGSVNINNGGYVANGGTNSYTEYSLTAYIQCTKSQNWCGRDQFSYEPSEGTATLSEAGSNFSKATLTVPNQNGGDDVVFTFTSNTANTQSIGYGRNANKTAMGNNCVVTGVALFDQNNQQYLFTLDKPLTVNNPY